MLNSQRVAIFVDGQNCYYSAKRYGNKEGKVCYPNFDYFLKLVGERSLVQAFVYCIDVEGLDQSAFFNSLEQLGYTVKVKKTKVIAGGKMKGNQDIEICLDVIAVSDRVDAVILVSGDSDFIPLVEFLKKKGIRIEVYGYEGCMDEELRRNADLGREISFSSNSLIISKEVD